jgi:hypothetical protein
MVVCFERMPNPWQEGRPLLFSFRQDYRKLSWRKNEIDLSRFQESRKLKLAGYSMSAHFHLGGRMFQELAISDITLKTI